MVSKSDFFRKKVSQYDYMYVVTRHALETRWLSVNVDYISMQDFSLIQHVSDDSQIRKEIFSSRFRKINSQWTSEAFSTNYRAR